MPLHLLIVDDDKEISSLMRLKLSREAPHFTIATADGGWDCLEYLKLKSVDCILSDYQMPGMDGMDLLKSLRRQGDEVPFIFLTAQGNEEVAREAFKNGAYDYFTKDIGFAHFARIINSVEQAVRQSESERAKARFESALVDEKNKLEAVLASISDGISIQDASYRVLYQNQAHRDIIGDHVGDFCYTAYQLSDDVCEVCPVADTFSDGLAHTVQKVFQSGGGPVELEITTSPLRDSTGRIIAAVEVARDVTGRKRAEEPEGLFRALVEESLVGVYIIQDDKFKYVNPRLAEIFGYTQEEMIGKMGAVDTTHPDDVELLRENVRKRLAGEVKSIHYQLRGIRKDGTGLEVEVYGSRTMYDGRPAVIGTLLDVTERSRTDEEKSVLFHMLTHDIKGPLTLIYGYAEIMAGDLDKDQLDMVGEIKKAARRISSLIDDMLALSSAQSPGFRLALVNVSLDEVLRQAIKDSELPASDMDVGIELIIDTPLPELYADKVQLSRAFGNLVANAVKYNRHGGEVHIHAWADGGPTGKVFVEVSDTGMGMSGEDLPHVFEKYYRGKSAGHARGTGLGLAVVKTMVEAHGGSVSVSSEERKGSTFKVTLPVRQ